MFLPPRPLPFRPEYLLWCVPTRYLDVLSTDRSLCFFSDGPCICPFPVVSPPFFLCVAGGHKLHGSAEVHRLRENLQGFVPRRAVGLLRRVQPHPPACVVCGGATGTSVVLPSWKGGYSAPCCRIDLSPKVAHRFFGMYHYAECKRKNGKRVEKVDVDSEP